MVNDLVTSLVALKVILVLSLLRLVSTRICYLKLYLHFFCYSDSTVRSVARRARSTSSCETPFEPLFTHSLGASSSLAGLTRLARGLSAHEVSCHVKTRSRATLCALRLVQVRYVQYSWAIKWRTLREHCAHSFREFASAEHGRSRISCVGKQLDIKL